MTVVGGSLGNVAGNVLGVTAVPALKANVFDSGLGKPQRTVVREAVIDLLQRLLIANGGYLQAVEESAVRVRGEHDDEGFMEIFDRLQGRAPSVLVYLGDKPYTPAGAAEMWTAEIDVHVYLLVNSLRGITARLSRDVVALGNPQRDPGVEVALEHIEELLIGQCPGGTKGQIREIRPQRETHVGTEQGFEMWEQIYTVRVSRSIRAKRDLTVDLKAINTYARLADQQTDADPPIVEADTEL